MTPRPPSMRDHHSGEQQVSGWRLSARHYFMKSCRISGPDIVTRHRRASDGYFLPPGAQAWGSRVRKWVKLFHFGERTGIDLPPRGLRDAAIRAVKENLTPNILKRMKARGSPGPTRTRSCAKNGNGPIMNGGIRLPVRGRMP